MPRYRRILVPVDGSATSNKALVAALDTARDHGGRVLLLHAAEALGMGAETFPVGPTEGARKVMEDALEVARAAGVEAETQLFEFPGEGLGEVVAREAQRWNADLIVVGTHGRRGLGRLLLGSGAEQIIRLAPVPVLVIRGDAH